MKKVLLHTTYASDTGVSGGPGQVISVEDERADQIVDGGFGEYVDEAEAAPTGRRRRGGRAAAKAQEPKEPKDPDPKGTPPSEPAG